MLLEYKIFIILHHKNEYKNREEKMCLRRIFGNLVDKLSDIWTEYEDDEALKTTENGFTIFDKCQNKQVNTE